MSIRNLINDTSSNALNPHPLYPATVFNINYELYVNWLKVIIKYTKIITTRRCPWPAPKNGYQNKILHMSSDHSPQNLDLATFYCGTATRTKGVPLWAFCVKLVPNDIAVRFDHADSFEIDYFDQYLHFLFWLKVNNDVVF